MKLFEIMSSLRIRMVPSLCGKSNSSEIWSSSTENDNYLKNKVTCVVYIVVARLWESGMRCYVSPVAVHSLVHVNVFSSKALSDYTRNTLHLIHTRAHAHTSAHRHTHTHPPTHRHTPTHAHRKAVPTGMLAGGAGQFLASPTDRVKVILQMEGRRVLDGHKPRSGGGVLLYQWSALECIQQGVC